MKVKFLLPARHELHEAAVYYNAQQAQLGEEFTEEVRRTVERIKRFPEAWSPLGGPIRRCQMRRFPYGVIYEMDNDEIIIIAIAHLHRAPEYWRDR